MASTPFVPVQQREAGESGTACLLSLARHHGLEIEPAEILSWTGLDSLRLDDLGLLFVAGELGFEALPLEGAFDELPEVPRPCVVGMREGHERYAVLLEIDAAGVLLADPVSGTTVQEDRESFVARWSGDAFQLTALPDKLRACQQRLVRERRWHARLLRPIGLFPFKRKQAVFCAGALAWLAVLLTAGWHGELQRVGGPGWLLGLGWALAWLGAWWSALLTQSCASCSRAGALAGGLPLGWAGVSGYTLLGLALMLQAEGAWRGFAWALPVGAHTALLALLARERIRCLPCLATAAGALLAAIGCWAAAFSGIELAVVAASGIGTWLVVAWARRRFPLVLFARACQLAQNLPRETAADAPLPLIVYVRDHCPSCVFYKASLRPGLAQEFGEALAIEERKAPPGAVPTPLLLVPGPPAVAAFGFDPETAYGELSAVLRQRLAVHARQLPTTEALWVVSRTLG